MPAAARRPVPSSRAAIEAAEDAEHATLRLALPLLRCATCGRRSDRWEHWVKRPRPEGSAWLCPSHRPSSP